MNISNSLCYAVRVAAVATVLAGCSNSGSPSSFAPSEMSQPNVTQARPGAQVRGSVTHYYLVTLGGLGGKYSAARGINNRGWIAGASTLRGSKSAHAALWRAGRLTDLGTLGGPDSAFLGSVKNTRGELAGFSQVQQTDPYLENFCNEPSIFDQTRLCQGFRWKNGGMTALPMLGGNNSVSQDVNNRDQVLGSAETGTQDPSCQAPQVFDYYGVIWQPNGKVVVLRPYSGDVISGAISINQHEQVVGSSGLCYWDQPQASIHAVLWQNGSAIDLGNLGGTQGNVGNDINDHGQIVGGSGVPGNQTDHAFLWQKGVGMKDLGTLPGDVWSFAFGINNKGQVVGQSCNEGFYHCRGFKWNLQEAWPKLKNWR